MTHLVAYVANNRPGTRDATGAFIPEAQRYIQLHGVEPYQVHTFNTAKRRPAARRWDFEAFCTDLYRHRVRAKSLALFCHGTSDGVQLGYKLEHAETLAGALKHVLRPEATVVLYACSTAENDVRDRETEEIGTATDGGFADTLRTELVSKGIAATVYGHKTAGHTTWNPYVVAFDPDCASIGGRWVVSPTGPLWRTWVDAMRNTDMRLIFPFMRQDAIREWLEDYSTRDRAYPCRVS